ncbi:hypothetical protein PO909_026882 [Leuciscus waleckii]
MPLRFSVTGGKCLLETWEGLNEFLREDTNKQFSIISLSNNCYANDTQLYTSHSSRMIRRELLTSLLDEGPPSSTQFPAHAADVGQLYTIVNFPGFSLPMHIYLLNMIWIHKGQARRRHPLGIQLQKMLLVLSEEHKEHLGFLSEVDSAVVGEFGRIAVEFLKKGSNPKIFEGAARKLNVPAESVQHGVEGLMYLLTESAKLMVSEGDFQDSVLVLGFSEELNQLLLQLYLENRKEIRQILGKLAPSLPHYHNLEWRLDVQVSSRALRQQLKPSVSLKLVLEDGESLRARVLQTDPSTLQHLIQELERALAELKSSHCRRVLRNIK